MRNFWFGKDVAIKSQYYEAYIFKIHLARNNRLWTRTLDKYTSAGLHERVVEKMSGPPPETTTTRTQTKDSHPVLVEIKISDPTGNRTPAAGLEGTYSVWVTIRYNFFFYIPNVRIRISAARK